MFPQFEGEGFPVGGRGVCAPGDEVLVLLCGADGGEMEGGGERAAEGGGEG